MGWILVAISVAFLLREYIKEKRQPTIPAEYWRNKELMNKDKLDATIPPEQVLKNLRAGKYYLSDEEYEKILQKERDSRDYSFREGENINSWMERLSRERKEKLDKLYGRDKEE